MKAHVETRRGRRRPALASRPSPAVHPAAVEALEGRVLFAAGDLDLTFGSTGDPGKARIQVEAAKAAVSDAANAVGVLPDGKILLVGQTGTDATGTQFAVSRLTKQGLPDSTFGPDGFGAVAESFSGDTAIATAILTGVDGTPALVNGLPVIGGYANTTSSPVLQFALTRLDGQGNFDASFGESAGLQLTSFDAEGGDARLAALVLAPTPGGDQRIIAVGLVNGQLALARYTTDGRPDPFPDPAIDPGQQGKAVIPRTTGSTTGFATIRGAALQRDGSIVVVGDSDSGQAAIAFVNADGEFLGFTESGALGGANAVAAAPFDGGGFYVVGPSVGPSAAGGPDSDLAVAHYFPDGSPDGAFGNGIPNAGGGVAKVDVAGRKNDVATSVAVQSDGRGGVQSIIVGGSTNVVRVTTNGVPHVTSADFAVARFNPDGTPDTGADVNPAVTFANNGATGLPFPVAGGGQGVAQGRGVAVQPDGGIVVAGVVPSSSLQVVAGRLDQVTRFGVARLLGTGPTFGTASISGTVYRDANQNGQRDDGEPGIPGVVVYFDRNDSAVNEADEPQAVSGEDGTYTIPELADGRYYRIREIRGDLIRTQPAGRFPLGFYDVTLAPAQAAGGFDFGNIEPADDVTPPTAADDAADTTPGKAVNVPVLANDTDNIQVDPTTVAVGRQPAGGKVAVDRQTGQVVYTPNAGFTGNDSFTYTVKDASGNASAAATVAVAVGVGGGQTAKPKANADVAQTNQGAAVDVDVLENDTSEVGLNRSSVAVATAPAHGQAAVDRTTGRVRYTPAAGFSGVDSFAYTVADTGGAASAPATVMVQVIGKRVGAGTLSGTFAARGGLPANVVAGVTFKSAVTVNVLNGTQQLVSGPVRVELLVSPTADDAGGTVLVSSSKKQKLKTGKSKGISLKASKVPANLAAGTYHVLARITAPDLTVTVIDSGKTVAVAAPFVNLSVTLTPPPTAMTVGKKTKLTVTIRNNGNVPAGGSVPVTFLLSADPTRDSGDVAFAVGVKPAKVKLKAATGTKAFKFSPTVPPVTPGNYFLIAVIDGGGLGDTNGVDNTAVSATQVAVS